MTVTQAARMLETGTHISATVKAEHDTLCPGRRRVWAALCLTARAEPAKPTPSRLVLAIDASSSIAGPQLDAAKRAAHAAIELAPENDELGLVTFAREVRVVREPAPTTRALRDALHAEVERIATQPGTALAAAAVHALALASTHSQRAEGHVLLMTDGRPTVGATHPLELVQSIQWSASRATLTTIGFGDAIDAPFLRWIGHAGLGRAQHHGDYDLVDEQIASELRAPARSLTSRLSVTVQVRAGVLVEHGGVDLDGVLVVPPLAPDHAIAVPFCVELDAALQRGRAQIGLVTLRTELVDAGDLVLELPIHVEIADALGAPQPDVVRARCGYLAERATQMVAESIDDSVEMRRRLAAVAGEIEVRAESAGIESDRDVRAALMVVRNTARDLAESVDAATEW